VGDEWESKSKATAIRGGTKKGGGARGKEGRRRKAVLDKGGVGEEGDVPKKTNAVKWPIRLLSETRLIDPIITAWP
jgi:hypothetical protein